MFEVIQHQLLQHQLAILKPTTATPSLPPAGATAVVTVPSGILTHSIDTQPSYGSHAAICLTGSFYSSQSAV